MRRHRPALALLAAFLLVPLLAFAGGADRAVQDGTGLITVESAASFEETWDRLRAAIEENENLRILATVDHAANAEGVGRALPPTRLLLFGNPNLGTPLMQEARTVAIDLPQKLLVWTDADGRVRVSYNDPAYLAARHGLAGESDVLRTIAGALEGLAAGATR